MLKIGILTFHYTNNYGASLQSYALYKYLKNKNYNVNIIDYQNPKMERDFNNVNSLNNGVIDYLKNLIFYSHSNRKRKQGFISFLNNVCLSQHHISDKKELAKQSNDYDLIFVGSDQVWNYTITGEDYSFFLDFPTRASKNSYAASFGLSQLDDEHSAIIGKMIKQFDNISVREYQGKEIVKLISGRESKIVADPTFLLNKDDWSIFCKERPIKQRYLLIYCFGLTDSIIKVANDVAKERGLKVVHIDGSFSMTIKNRWIRLHGLSPSDWVNALYYADFIITNSFHGTAFSINFEKDFLVELLPPPAKVNSRLINILSMMRLENRLINNGNWSKSGIDYTEARGILEKLRNDSYLFIEKACKDVNV